MSSHRKCSIALGSLILLAGLAAGGCSGSGGGFWACLFPTHCGPAPAIPPGPSHGYRTTQWRAWEDGSMAERTSWTGGSEADECLELQPPDEPIEPRLPPVETETPSPQVRVLIPPQRSEPLPRSVASQSPQPQVHVLPPPNRTEPTPSPAAHPSSKPQVRSLAPPRSEPTPLPPAPLPPDPQANNSQLPSDLSEDESAATSRDKDAAARRSAIGRLRASARSAARSEGTPCPHVALRAAVSADAPRDPGLTVLHRWLRFVPCDAPTYAVMASDGTVIKASAWPRRFSEVDEGQMVRGASYQVDLPVRQE